MNALDGIIDKDGRWIVKDLPPDMRLTLAERHLHLECGNLWADIYPSQIVLAEVIGPADALRYAALLRVGHEIWEQGYGDWQYSKEETDA